MTIPTTRKFFDVSAAMFALLCLSGGVALCPVVAAADGHHDHGGYHDGRGHDDGHWRRGYDRHDWRGGPVYRPYEVYAPAPVYYAPQPSPGINLFFPVHIR
jgi:hypothetical protein